MRLLAPALLLGLSLAQAADAGFFRTRQEKGIWWLVDNNGKPFYSAGINVIQCGGDPKDLNKDNPDYFGLLYYPTFEAWWKVQGERMNKWGFNTIGGWADERILANPDRPFVVSLHLGSYIGAPWIDPATKAALDIIRPYAEPIARYKDNPLLIGYFLDNELGWYEDAVFDYWAAQPETDRGKQKIFEMFEAYYKGDLREFLKDFKVDPVPKKFSSLKRKFNAIISRPGRRPNIIYHFLEWCAGEYYRILAGEIRRIDPNHLLLGDRYPSFYTQPVVRAAGRWMDVVSVNFNTYAQNGWISPAFFDGISRLSGKPILVGEFYAAAMENRSGNKNLHGPFLTVQTQAERAVGASAMAEQMARLPYMVGYHWFQNTDEPPAGRGDGEDFNMGLLDIYDKPYEELTEAFAKVNARVNELHIDGPAPRGLKSRKGAWEVPGMSATLTIDGQLDDWVCPVSWAPGACARAPWVPFADFYLTWRPEGLYVGTVYHEYWGGEGDPSLLASRQRLILVMTDGVRPPAGVALVGFGEREGAPPPPKTPDTRRIARILPGAPLGNGVLTTFDGIWGAQWDRSLLRTGEIFVPARMFGKESLAQGDIILLGMSLVMSGDTKETFWPASQTSAAPDSTRLARLRLGKPVDR